MTNPYVLLARHRGQSRAGQQQQAKQTKSQAQQHQQQQHKKKGANATSSTTTTTTTKKPTTTTTTTSAISSNTDSNNSISSSSSTTTTSACANTTSTDVLHAGVAPTDKTVMQLKAHHTKLSLTNNINDYTILCKLGEGGFGDVMLALTKSGEKVVVKKVKKTPVTETLVANEVEAGRRLKHKNVVHLYGYFSDESFHYLVMEYIKGLDLFTFMENREFAGLKEIEAKKLFRQLVQAVQHSHQRSVAHLDIKMENVLISNSTKNGNNKRIKLIDYGLCDLQHPGKLTSRWVGSPDYAADELLLKQSYKAPKADVWSLGVILYIMLFGQIPFERSNRFRLLQKGIHPTLNFPKQDESTSTKPKVSQSAKDLIKHMLASDPNNRFDMDLVAKHPWVVKKNKLSVIECLAGGNELNYDTE